MPRIRSASDLGVMRHNNMKLRQEICKVTCDKSGKSQTLQSLIRSPETLLAARMYPTSCDILSKIENYACHTKTLHFHDHGHFLHFNKMPPLSCPCRRCCRRSQTPVWRSKSLVVSTDLHLLLLLIAGTQALFRQAETLARRPTIGRLQRTKSTTINVRRNSYKTWTCVHAQKYIRT